MEISDTDVRNITSLPFRYLYLLQPDGIGTQFVYISLLLDYATRANCSLIVDFRLMAFFASSGGVCDEAELAQVLRFHTDRIVYRARDIDRLVREQANEIVGVTFYEATNSLTRNKAFPCVSARDLLSGLALTDTDDGLYDQLATNPAARNASRSLDGILKLVGEYHRRFVDHRPTITSCLGIHARFGNGEKHTPQDRMRLKVTRELFFSAMDCLPDDRLFLCTDTPSFLSESIVRYDGRVVWADRYMSPEGCGPGHNVWSVRAGPEERTEYLKERRRVGPYRLLGEALVDMFLLGDCRMLICSKSFFSHYAREVCGVEAIVLD